MTTKLLNKLVSLILIPTFLSSDLAFAQASNDKLAAASRFDDLLGQEAQVMRQIKFYLELQADASSAGGNSIGLKKLREDAGKYDSPGSKTQFFFREMQPLPNGNWAITCRTSAGTGTLTYHVVISGERRDGAFPVEVYTEREWGKRGVIESGLRRAASGARDSAARDGDNITITLPDNTTKKVPRVAAAERLTGPLNESLNPYGITAAAGQSGNTISLSTSNRTKEPGERVFKVIRIPLEKMQLQRAVDELLQGAGAAGAKERATSSGARSSATGAVVKILLADAPEIDTEAKSIKSVVSEHGGRAVLIDTIGIGKDENDLRKMIKKERPEVIIIRSDTKAFKKPAFVKFAGECGVRAIIRMGSGVDNVDLDATRKAGISVIRTHGNDNSVANLAFRFLLAALDRPNIRQVIHEQNDMYHHPLLGPAFDVSLDEFNKACASSVKKGRGEPISEEQLLRILYPIADKRFYTLIIGLAGKKIGLIGFGPTAQAFAGKLKMRNINKDAPFTVMATSDSLDGRGTDPEMIRERRRTADDLGVIYPGEETVLREADIISLHLPEKDETKDWLSLDRLRLASKATIIINTARQGLIQEEALRQFLSRGKDRLYFADVDLAIKGKPIPELKKLSDDYPDQFFALPHIAASTEDAAIRVEKKTSTTLFETISNLLGEKTAIPVDVVNGVPLSPIGAGRATSSETRDSTTGTEKKAPIATHKRVERIRAALKEFGGSVGSAQAKGIFKKHGLSWDVERKFVKALLAAQDRYRPLGARLKLSALPSELAAGEWLKSLSGLETKDAQLRKKASKKSITPSKEAKAKEKALEILEALTVNNVNSIIGEMQEVEKIANIGLSGLLSEYLGKELKHISENGPYDPYIDVMIQIKAGSFNPFNERDVAALLDLVRGLEYSKEWLDSTTKKVAELKKEVKDIRKALKAPALSVDGYVRQEVERDDLKKRINFLETYLETLKKGPASKDASRDSASGARDSTAGGLAEQQEGNRADLAALIGDYFEETGTTESRYMDALIEIASSMSGKHLNNIIRCLADEKPRDLNQLRLEKVLSSPTPLDSAIFNTAITIIKQAMSTAEDISAEIRRLSNGDQVRINKSQELSNRILKLAYGSNPQKFMLSEEFKGLVDKRISEKKQAHGKERLVHERGTTSGTADILDKAKANLNGPNSGIVNIYPNRAKLGKAEAEDVASELRRLIKEKGKAVLVFAAAPSQNEFLDALAQEKDIGWSKVVAFHLDEYFELQRGHKNTFEVYLNDRLFNRLAAKPKVYFIKDLSGTPEEICAKYGELIMEEGGIDIACIGEGENAHIAFNDPGALFFDDKLVRVVAMDEMCRRQQFRDYANDPDPEKRYKTLEDVPRRAITLTIPAILSAGRIFCSVPAISKQYAVRSSILGPVTHAYPASLLKRHEYVRYYFDRDSSLLLGMDFEQDKTLSFTIPQKTRVDHKVIERSVRFENLPSAKRVAVIDYDGEAAGGCYGLIRRLQSMGNDVVIYATNGLPDHIRTLQNSLIYYNPEVILFPDRTDKRPGVKAIATLVDTIMISKIWGGKKDLTLIEYETSGAALGNNLFHILTEAAYTMKSFAINAYQSQLRRLRFDLVADAAMAVNMAKLRSLGAIPYDAEGDYAEVFDLVYFNNGQRSRPDGVKGLSKLNMKNGHAVSLLPHYDDELSIAGLVNEFLNNGFDITPLYMTTGHRAAIVDKDGRPVSDKEERVRIREAEALEANKRLGIKTLPQFLRFGFYDRPPDADGNRVVSDEEKKRVYGLIKSEYAEFKKSGKKESFVIFAPQANDAHPDHRATHDIGTQAAERLSKEESAKIAVIYYKGAWAENFNAYSYMDDKIVDGKLGQPVMPSKMRASLFSGLLNALVAPELVSLKGHGSMPLKPEQLGGGSAERFKVTYVEPKGKVVTPKEAFIFVDPSPRANASGTAPKGKEEYFSARCLKMGVNPAIASELVGFIEPEGRVILSDMIADLRRRRIIAADRANNNDGEIIKTVTGSRTFGFETVKAIVFLLNEKGLLTPVIQKGDKRKLELISTHFIISDRLRRDMKPQERFDSAYRILQVHNPKLAVKLNSLRGLIGKSRDSKIFASLDSLGLTQDEKMVLLPAFSNFSGARSSANGALIGRASPYFIGMSMGGTKLTVMLYRMIDGKPEALYSNSFIWKDLLKLDDERDIAGPNKDLADTIVSRIAEIVRDILKTYELGINNLNNIGCTSPGPLDAETGVIGTECRTFNMPFDKYPFVAQLKEALGTEFVDIRHDSHASLEAETAFGALSRVANGYYVIQGTGLGGSPSVNERYYTEVPELTEPGHHIVGAPDPLSRNKRGYHFRFIQKYGKGHPYEVVAEPDPNKEYQIKEKEAEELIASGKYRKEDFIWTIEGEKDFEDIVAGVGLIPMLKDKNRLASMFGGKTADYSGINEPKDLSELAINGSENEKYIAQMMIMYIAEQVGRGLASLIAASNRKEWQLRKIVMGSTIGERLGIDSKGKILLTREGKDFYYYRINECAKFELTSEFGWSDESANLISIVRSNLTQAERETAGFNRQEAETGRATPKERTSTSGLKPSYQDVKSIVKKGNKEEIAAVLKRILTGGASSVDIEGLFKELTPGEAGFLLNIIMTTTELTPLIPARIQRSERIRKGLAAINEVVKSPGMIAPAQIADLVNLYRDTGGKIRVSGVEAQHLVHFYSTCPTDVKNGLLKDALFRELFAMANLEWFFLKSPNLDRRHYEATITLDENNPLKPVKVEYWQTQAQGTMQAPAARSKANINYGKGAHNYKENGGKTPSPQDISENDQVSRLIAFINNAVSTGEDLGQILDHPVATVRAMGRGAFGYHEAKTEADSAEKMADQELYGYLAKVDNPAVIGSVLKKIRMPMISAQRDVSEGGSTSPAMRVAYSNAYLALVKRREELLGRPGLELNIAWSLYLYKFSVNSYCNRYTDEQKQERMKEEKGRAAVKDDTVAVFGENYTQEEAHKQIDAAEALGYHALIIFDPRNGRIVDFGPTQKEIMQVSGLKMQAQSAFSSTEERDEMIALIAFLIDPTKRLGLDSYSLKPESPGAIANIRESLKALLSNDIDAAITSLGKGIEALEAWIKNTAVNKRGKEGDEFMLPIAKRRKLQLENFLLLKSTLSTHPVIGILSRVAGLKTEEILKFCIKSEITLDDLKPNGIRLAAFLKVIAENMHHFSGLKTRVRYSLCLPPNGKTISFLELLFGESDERSSLKGLRVERGDSACKYFMGSEPFPGNEAKSFLGEELYEVGGLGNAMERLKAMPDVNDPWLYMRAPEEWKSGDVGAQTHAAGIKGLDRHAAPNFEEAFEAQIEALSGLLSEFDRSDFLQSHDWAVPAVIAIQSALLTAGYNTKEQIDRLDELLQDVYKLKGLRYNLLYKYIIIEAHEALLGAGHNRQAQIEKFESVLKEVTADYSDTMIVTRILSALIRGRHNVDENHRRLIEVVSEKDKPGPKFLELIYERITMRGALLDAGYKPEEQIKILLEELSKVDQPAWTDFKSGEIIKARNALLMAGYKPEEQIARLSEILSLVNEPNRRNDYIFDIIAVRGALLLYAAKAKGRLTERFSASGENGAIAEIAAVVKEAGLEIPTHPGERYTLLLPFEFFANGEFEAQKANYGDRFNINRANGADNILAKARGLENRTIALVPNDMPEEGLKRLADAGLRFIRTDIGKLQEARAAGDKDRKAFQLNTYVMMLLARHIKDANSDSSIYKVLSFYLKSHFELDNIAVADYIEAIVSGDIARLIKGYLSYKPAEQYRVPEYDKVAATLVAA